MQNYHSAGVCMYARASTKNRGNDGLSIADQLERGRQWCARNGAVLVDTVAEVGTGAPADRPGLSELIMRATGEDHPYDVILICSPSRLFRNVSSFEQCSKTLEEAKVAIVSVT